MVLESSVVSFQQLGLLWEQPVLHASTPCSKAWTRGFVLGGVQQEPRVGFPRQVPRAVAGFAGTLSGLDVMAVVVGDDSNSGQFGSSANKSVSSGSARCAPACRICSLIYDHDHLECWIFHDVFLGFDVQTSCLYLSTSNSPPFHRSKFASWTILCPCWGIRRDADHGGSM